MSKFAHPLQRLYHTTPEERREFARIFNRDLRDYFEKGFGFDIIKFDEELIKPPNGTSCRQHLRYIYGEDAVKLIEGLIHA